MGRYGLGWGEQTSAAGAAAAGADPAGRFTPTALPGNLQPVKDISPRHLQICNSEINQNLNLQPVTDINLLRLQFAICNQ